MSSRKARRQQPERDVVHARERHVRRADHDRDHPVGEAADQRRHDHEEDHDQRVRGGEGVVHGLAAVDGGVALETVDHLRQAGENLDARLLASSMRITTDRAPPMMPAKIAKIR